MSKVAVTVMVVETDWLKIAGSNKISSGPDSALASSIAAQREHCPLALRHVPSPGFVSLALPSVELLTVNVAATAVPAIKVTLVMSKNTREREIRINRSRDIT